MIAKRSRLIFFPTRRSGTSSWMTATEGTVRSGKKGHSDRRSDRIQIVPFQKPAYGTCYTESEVPERRVTMKRKRRSKFLEIAEVPALIVILFMFCYQVVYRWFIVLRWETMHVALKIALGVLFVVVVCGLIRRIILQIRFLRNH